jgi:predicted transporter
MAKVWGPNHAKALMRAMPSLAVAGGLAILCMLALAYQSSSGVLVGTLVAGCVCSAVIAASVILTNHPRRLIPPKFRDERSLIAEWRRRG